MKRASIAAALLGSFVTVLAAGPTMANSTVGARIYMGDDCTHQLAGKIGHANVSRSGTHVATHVKGTLPANDNFHVELWRHIPGDCIQIGSNSDSFTAGPDGAFDAKPHFSVPRRYTRFFVALNDETANTYNETHYLIVAP